MKLTVNAKLLGVLGLACAALAVSAVLSLASLSWLASAGQGIYDRGVVGITTVAELALAIEAQGGIVARTPTEINIDAVGRYKAEFTTRGAEMDRALTALAESAIGRAHEALLKDVRAASAVFQAEAGKVFDFGSRLAQEQALQALQGPCGVAERKAKEAVGRLVTATSEAAKAEAVAMQATARRTGALLIGAAVLLGAVVAGAGLLIARAITRPLKQTVTVLEAVALGDLTGRLDVHTRDEVGQMAAALNQAIEGMQTALHAVRQAAAQAATASQQLSGASHQLSSGAQEQASSLVETAASLEEITGAVKQNADNARQANQLAVASREVAEKGGQVVAEAVASMGEINASSRKIADIITTIDEIAFQTNLLALNAAVEAARAGEQGRGFAVVAAEVRNLAQRSATAAKEIKGLIQDSVQKVGAGSQLVNRSGATLEEIVGSVKRVTDIIAAIAAASAEQTSGIDQVNKAVAEMDHVAQANAAQTEQLSSTAQGLASQAEELQALVARFNLDDERGTRVAAGVAAPPTRRPAPAGAPPSQPAAAKPAVAKAGRRPPASVPALVGSNSHGQAKDAGFDEWS